MSNRKEFSPEPENIHWMKPIHEGNREYGYRITELYKTAVGYDLQCLFQYGISGMVFGEREPKSDELIRSILQSGIYCRPEDFKEGQISVSPGQYANCERRIWRNINLRWYREVRLQGDFKALLQDDYPNEDTGTIAVAMLGNLARAAIMPSKKEGSIVIKRLTLAGMEEDEDHEHPWIAVEIDLYVHQSLFSMIPFPHDAKTGYVPIDALEKMMETEYA